MLADRRQVVVLYVDIVDALALTRQLDAEDFRALSQALRTAVAAIVNGVGGRLLSSPGDGLIATFGVPTVQEDDVERAFQCAQAVLTVSAPLAERFVTVLPGRLELSAAVHAGTAVVEAATDDEPVSADDLGQLVRVAKTLWERAAPATVVSDAQTLPLATRALQFEPLDAVAETDLTAYRLRAAAPPFADAGGDDRGGDMIGREEQMRFLQRTWLGVLAGSGRTVFVQGDAGIGKSFFSRQFVDYLSGWDVTVLRLYCHSLQANNAFYPLIERLRWDLGLDATAEERLVRDRLRVLLLDLKLDIDTLLPVLTGLLLPASGEVARGDSQKQRTETLRALVALTLALSRQRALVLVFEDLHWMDASTGDYLERLIGQLRSQPMLLIATSRQPISLRTRSEPVDTLELESLTPPEARLLINQVLANKPIPELIAEQITARANGVPLYIEQLTLSVLESGKLEEKPDRYVLKAGAQTVDVPRSLQNSLLARLDNLKQGKPLVQLASVLGRRFPAELLLDLWQQVGEEGDYQAQLDDVIAAGLLLESRHPDHPMLTFQHVLIRDEAYASLLKSRRQKLHSQAADLIIERHKDLAAMAPDSVAHHYASAGRPMDALVFLQTAAKACIQRSANIEALAQLQLALEQVRLLPESEQRDGLELELLVGSIGPTIAARGYGAADIEDINNRALQLCQSLGASDKLFPVLYSRWSYNQVTGRMLQSHGIASKMMEVAVAAGNASAEMVAARLLGTSSIMIGRFSAAETHLERAISLYQPEQHVALTYLYGTDVRVMSQCYLSFAQWLQGDRRAALASASEAIGHAREIGHANTTGFALMHLAVLYAIDRQVDALVRTVAQLVELAQVNELPFWGANSRGFQGWVMSQQGDYDAAVSVMQEGLKFMQAANLVFWRPLYLAWYADTVSHAGRHAEALQHLDEAQSIIENGGERWAEAETHRVRADVMARIDGHDQDAVIKACQAAIDAAEQMQARIFRLRACNQLAQYLQRIDRSGEIGIGALVREAYEALELEPTQLDASEATLLLDAS